MRKDSSMKFFTHFNSNFPLLNNFVSFAVLAQHKSTNLSLSLNHFLFFPFDYELLFEIPLSGY